MILLIDDDPVYLQATQVVLEEDGHRVVSFTSPADALLRAAGEPPDLIVCDIRMPDMDGHEFQRRYEADFASRQTPFIFLSAISSPEHIVQALDAGAVDYVEKPVDPAVLRARVRGQLRRRQRQGSKVFRGDLGAFAFPRLLRHCEESGLTGSVEISGGGTHARILFRAGKLDEESVEDDVLGRLFDLSGGSFVIFAEPAGLPALEASRSDRSQDRPAASNSNETAPAGRLSAVRVGGRQVQIQTELRGSGHQAVATVALLGGKTLLKREARPPGGGRDALEEAIARQHREVEDEVRRKLEQLVAKLPSSDSGPMQRFAELYRQGIEKYEDGNYAAATMLWEMAVAIDPSNRMLTLQIEAARKKAFAGTCVDADQGDGSI